MAEAYINDDGECEEINYLHNGLPSADGFTELVTRSQAEELLAAERAKKEMLAESLHIQIKRVNELEANNAALTERVKYLETEHGIEEGLKLIAVERAEALEDKLAAAEKALEPFANAADGRKSKTVAGSVCFSQHYLLAARAVLGGKPS